MNISARTNYASRAVLALSMHWPSDTPLQIHEIAKRQDIPIKFLTQILIQLKSYGMVISIRGKNGGYLLAKNPSEISVYDIISQFENQHDNEHSVKNKDNIIVNFYKELNEDINRQLKKMNFETLAEKQKANDSVVTFQI